MLDVAAHRVQPHEPAQRAVGDQRVDATGEHEIGGAPAQQLDALADGGGAGRAGGGHGHARPAETEPERQQRRTELGMTIGMVSGLSARTPCPSGVATAAPRRSPRRASPTPHTTAHRSGGGSSPHWSSASGAAPTARAATGPAAASRRASGRRPGRSRSPGRRATAVPRGSRSSANTSADAAAGAQGSPTAPPACCPAGGLDPGPEDGDRGGGRRRHGSDRYSTDQLPAISSCAVERHRVDELSQPGGEEAQAAPRLAERLAGERTGQRASPSSGSMSPVRVGRPCPGREDGQDVLQRQVVAGHRRADLEGGRVGEVGPAGALRW